LRKQCRNNINASSNLFYEEKHENSSNIVKTFSNIKFETTNFLDLDLNILFFGLGGFSVAGIAGYYYYTKSQNKKIELRLNQEILGLQNKQNYLRFDYSNKENAYHLAQRNAPNTLQSHYWNVQLSYDEYGYFTWEIASKIERFNQMKERLNIMPFDIYETPEYIKYRTELKKALNQWTLENHGNPDISHDEFLIFIADFDKIFMEPDKSIYLFDVLNYGDPIITELFENYPFLLDLQKRSRNSFELNTYINMRQKTLKNFEYKLENVVKKYPEVADVLKEYKENYCFFMLDAYPQFVDLLEKNEEFYELYNLYAYGVTSKYLENDLSVNIPKTDIPNILESNDSSFFFQVKTGLKWLISLFY